MQLPFLRQLEKVEHYFTGITPADKAVMRSDVSNLLKTGVLNNDAKTKVILPVTTLLGGLSFAFPAHAGEISFREKVLNRFPVCQQVAKPLNMLETVKLPLSYDPGQKGLGGFDWGYGYKAPTLEFNNAEAKKVIAEKPEEAIKDFDRQEALLKQNVSDREKSVNQCIKTLDRIKSKSTDFGKKLLEEEQQQNKTILKTFGEQRDGLLAEALDEDIDSEINKSNQKIDEATTAPADTSKSDLPAPSEEYQRKMNAALGLPPPPSNSAPQTKTAGEGMANVDKSEKNTASANSENPSSNLGEP